ncbi:MAG: hypothetical protein AAB870_05200 [Patescibacteria group bacterium]
MNYAFRFFITASLCILSLLESSCNSTSAPALRPSDFYSPRATALPSPPAYPSPTPIISVVPQPTSTPSQDIDVGQTQFWTAPSTTPIVSGFEEIFFDPAGYALRSISRIPQKLPHYIDRMFNPSPPAVWKPAVFYTPEDIEIPKHTVHNSLDRLLGLVIPEKPHDYINDYISLASTKTPYTLVLIHGNNQETKNDTLFRWHRLIEYFKRYPKEYKRIGSPLILLYQYLSAYSILDNAHTFQTLQNILPKAPILFLGHSRGGVLARTIRSLEDYDPTRWMGIVQLASPNHGSPLLIPDLMLAAFSSQLFGGIKKIIYTKSMIEWRALSIPERIEDFATLNFDLGRTLMSFGTQSLFFDGVTVPIPNLAYTLVKYPLIDGFISPYASHGMRCFSTHPYDYYLKMIEYRDLNSTAPACHYNYMDRLHLEEYAKGVIPDTIMHAGYLSKEQKKEDEAIAFMETAAASIDYFLDKSSDADFERKALNWLSAQFMYIPTTPKSARDTDYRINDGMVDIGSQCDLRPGDNVFSSTDGVLSVDQSIIDRRKGTTSLECIVHPDMNHADIVETQDTRYWKSVTDSLLTLYDRYNKYYKNSDKLLSDHAIKEIYQYLNAVQGSKTEKVSIVRYNAGWRVTITPITEYNMLTREVYYFKQVDDKLRPSTEQELAYKK